MSDIRLPKPMWLPMGDQAVMLDYTGFTPVHQVTQNTQSLSAKEHEEIAAHIQRLAAHMRRLALPGLIDIVPALTRLTFVVDPLILSQAALKSRVMLEHDKSLPDVALTSRHWVMPVCYDGDYAPDLEEVAERCDITAEEVVARHLACPLRVSVMGFMPGSAYLVGVDETLTLPRRANPRTKVPAQSVGIAIGQSVIYPLDSPGGWHLIGRTPFPVFDPHRAEPILFDAGDVVEFRRISEQEFAELEQAYQAGKLSEADLRKKGGIMTVTILQAGPYSTIQDLGRFGYQHLGVPTGGALDREALAIGNALLGNEANTNGIEVCFGGFSAQFDAPSRLVLVGSVNATITLETATGESAAYHSCDVIEIGAGDIVTIPPFGDSLSVLLCVAGGLDVPVIYGGTGATPNAKIGGLEGRILQAGDIIPLGKAEQAPAPAIQCGVEIFAKRTTLRIMLGPQDYWFEPAAIEALLETPYKVSPQTSRMGMRLQGAALNHKGPADIISDAMMRGVLQVPADGQPIIAMADHGTMGGYTKIGCVIAADIPALGRIRPGDSIHFAAVTAEEAGLALQHHEAARRMAMTGKNLS